MFIITAANAHLSSIKLIIKFLNINFLLRTCALVGVIINNNKLWILNTSALTSKYKFWHLTKEIIPYTTVICLCLGTVDTLQNV